jgi:uncharacterized protein YndB with AHSA1/START domain
MREPGLIQMMQFIPHPPARVWHALTDPTLHAQWWTAGDVRPVPGHNFKLDMGKWGLQPCVVIAALPERLFSYTFAPGTVDTTIAWRLQPEGSGTQLLMEHQGFHLDTPLGRAAFNGMGGGWPTLLVEISDLLGE